MRTYLDVKSDIMISHKIFPTLNSSSPPRDLKNYFHRLNDLTPEDLNTLSSCSDLKEFLVDICAYLREYPQYAESVAHYLMGKVDYLNINTWTYSYLQAPGRLPGIKAEHNRVLSNLLRTSRYGVFGHRESSSKTITKLENLEKRLEFSLSSLLRIWCNGTENNPVIPQQTAGRKAAIDYLLVQGLYSPEWYLNSDILQVGLTAPPPIPKHVKFLSLVKNQIASLEGFTDGLNNKSVLDNSDLTIDLCGNPLSASDISAIRKGCYRAQIIIDQHSDLQKFQLSRGLRM